MQIKGGHGKKTLEDNIKAYIEDGYSEDDAKAIAKKIARRFYYKKYPDGKLPDYLEDDNEN